MVNLLDNPWAIWLQRVKVALVWIQHTHALSSLISGEGEFTQPSSLKFLRSLNLTPNLGGFQIEELFCSGLHATSTCYITTDLDSVSQDILVSV